MRRIVHFRLLAVVTFLAAGLPFSGRNASAQAPARETDKKRFALLVACDNYDEKEWEPLKCSRNDILGFQQILLESQFPADNLIVMHGDQPDDLRPNGRRILRQLDLLLKKVDAESTVIVAFAGHGIQYKNDPKTYFCPHDGEAEDPSSLISLDTVYNKLGRSAAKRKMLLVDACRGDPRSKVARARLATDLESVTRPQDQAVPADVVAFFSCSAGQKSYEDPKLGHGIFFYHLMKGWHESAVDRWGNLKLDELARYASRETQKYAQTRFQADQNPDLKNAIDGSWILSHSSGEIRRLTGPIRRSTA
jgi:uncharacterized caspase-like protein